MRVKDRNSIVGRQRYGTQGGALLCWWRPLKKGLKKGLKWQEWHSFPSSEPLSANLSKNKSTKLFVWPWKVQKNHLSDLSDQLEWRFFSMGTYQKRAWARICLKLHNSWYFTVLQDSCISVLNHSVLDMTCMHGRRHACYGVIFMYMYAQKRWYWSILWRISFLFPWEGRREGGAVNCTRLICDLTSSLSLFINCQDDDDDDENDEDDDDDIRNDDENHNFQIECHWHVYSRKLHCVSDPFHE